MQGREATEWNGAWVKLITLGRSNRSKIIAKETSVLLSSARGRWEMILLLDSVLLRHVWDTVCSEGLTHTGETWTDWKKLRRAMKMIQGLADLSYMEKLRELCLYRLAKKRLGEVKWEKCNAIESFGKEKQ